MNQRPIVTTLLKDMNHTLHKYLLTKLLETIIFFFFSFFTFFYGLERVVEYI